MSWISKAYRSISLSGTSAIRYLVNRDDNLETKRFHELVRDISQDVYPEDQLNYFLLHFGDLPKTILLEMKINPEVTLLISSFIPFFMNQLEEEEKIVDKGFLFLNKGVDLFLPDQKNSLILYNFIFKIMEKDDEKLLKRSLYFTEKCLLINNLLNLFFAKNTLPKLWNECYILNPNTCIIYGPLFIQAASGYNFKSLDRIQMFSTAVIQSFEQFKICSITSGNSIEFVASVIYKINTGNFLDNFFNVSKLFFTGIQNFNCFYMFFQAQTSDTKIVWKAFNDICNFPDLSTNLLISALDIVEKFKENPNVKLFSFRPFIKRASELPVDSQQIIFDLISDFSLKSKIKFYKKIIPPWRTGFDSSLTLKFVILNNWESNIGELLSYLILKTEFKIFFQNFRDNKDISDLVTFFVDKLQPTHKILPEIFKAFIILSHQGYNIGTIFIEKILNFYDISIFFEDILKSLKEKLVNDDVFKIITKLANKSPKFIQLFIDNFGIKFLSYSLESDASLDFLAAIVSSGPYETIDDFISQCFDTSILKTLDEKHLIKLMMGVPQNSEATGLLRIPSLCSYVKNIKITTQFDRFTFGMYASKHLTNLKREQILQYSPTFIDSNTVETIIHDPNIIIQLTSLDYPHFSVFQCHMDSKNCSASFKLSNSNVFWICIEKVVSKTIVLSSSSFGYIYIDHDNTFDIFGSKIKFNLKQWYMITIIINNRSFQQQSVQCYLDNEKVFENKCKLGNRIILGSDTETNAFYYLSGSIQTSDDYFSNEDINKYYQNGPSVFCPTNIRMKKGFLFVPYYGFLKYIERFGGQNFIFSELLKSDNYNSFLLLIKSAFNLLHLNAINSDFFFPALRFILLEKKNFYNYEFEQILVHEIQTFPDHKWDYFSNLICDHNLISTINFGFLTTLFESQYNWNKAFYFLVDSFIIFDLPTNIEREIKDAICCYISINEEYIKLISLMIICLPHIEKDTVASLKDESILEKQNFFSGIIIDNFDVFIKYNTFEEILFLISSIKDDIGLNIFELTCKFANINEQYFDNEAMKKYEYLFIAYSIYPTFWKSLFALYTCKTADKFSDFSELDVQRPGLTQMILDLLPYLIRYELSNNTSYNDFLSTPILLSLLKLMEKSKILITDYGKSVQRLCSLGFDQQPVKQMPFQTLNDQISRSKSRPSIFKKYQKQEIYDYNFVKSFDLSLYNETISYLEKSIIIENNFKKEIKIPKIPENFDKILESSNLVKIIVNLAAQIFVLKTKEIITYSSMFERILVNGSDVDPIIAISMHQKISLGILSEPGLSDIAYENLIKFLKYRVAEGWWDNKVYIIFEACLKKQTKSLYDFVITCLIHCKNLEIQSKMIKKVLQLELFQNLFTDKVYSSIFYYFIINNENRLIEEKEKISILYKKDSLISLDEAENQFNIFSNNLHKITLKNSSHLREIRNNIKQKITLNKLRNYKKKRLINAFITKKAFLYQFSSRFNRCNLEIENIVCSLFEQQYKQKNLQKDGVWDYMVVPAPNPLCVPQKTVPLCYIKSTLIQKTSKSYEIPLSKHSYNYQTKLKELKNVQYAPFCYDNWYLPIFLKISLIDDLKNFFNVKSLFKCAMISTAEILPCVGAFTKDSFCLVMNSSIENDNNLVIYDTSDMFCHYVAFECASHGFYGKTKLFAHHPVVTVKFNDIIYAIPRRYVYQNIEIDLYLVNGLHLTFVLSEQERRFLIQKTKYLTKVKYNIQTSLSKMNLLSEPIENITQLWQNQEISTFDYLLCLNSKSGRSFNDFSQYPVFPWILGDFDLSKPTYSRDLTKPMGAQTKDRESRFIYAFKEVEPHCHYGTHYSSPASVFHFLLRIEPFTIFNLHLHNGFDHKDRQFSCINESWKSASESNQSDVKELIPEFYSFPLFFDNINNLNLGERTNGISLNTVILPPWCKNSIEFIWKMRESLESDESNEHINDWIDLIFGYKQRGKAAIDAINLFQPLTYDTSLENCENIMDNKAIVDTVNQFGQTPSQLFLAPHPKISKKILPDLSNSKLIFVDINLNIEKNTYIKSIQFQDLTPILLPEFEHFCGTRIKIWDNYIECNNVITASLDAIVCSNISKDNSLLVVASKFGYISLFSSTEKQIHFIEYIQSPLFDIQSISISTYHGLICASTKSFLLLFDYSTQLFLRKEMTDETIISTSFDDVSNFIIGFSDNYLYIYTLELKLIAKSQKMQSKICALSICDSIIWNQHPFYLIGHENGVINMCIFDISSSTINITKLINMSCPITNITIFSNNQAAIAICSNGTSKLIVIYPINHQIISRTVFTKCSICNTMLTKNQKYCCGSCGLCICKKCIGIKSNYICKSCKEIFRINENNDAAIEDDEAFEIYNSVNKEEEEITELHEEVNEEEDNDFINNLNYRKMESRTQSCQHFSLLQKSRYLHNTY